MNITVLHSIVAETAGRLVGHRIAAAVALARDWIELETDGREPLRLGFAVTKALPLLYVVSRPRKATERVDASPLEDLVGSTIASLSALPGRRTAVLLTSCTDHAGREVRRSLTVDLGERPSFLLEDAGSCDGPEAEPAMPGGRDAVTLAHGVDDGTYACGPPAVAWRRDEAGRLHVGLPPNDGPWEGTLTFVTWNEAALHAARELLPEIAASARRAALRRVMKRALARKRRALGKVRAEIEDSERAGEYRHKAQLLLMRKDSLRRGDARLRLLDYDGVTEVEIDVDPALPPARNAEALFARARKAERRAGRAPERRAQLESEIDALEDEISGLETASPAVLSELEERFRPPRRREPRRREEERARFRTYTVAGGWKVLVGKSNRDNDILTHRIARPGDLWFHARQSPGSHVILQKAGRKSEPGPDAIMQAAAIAAFHSKSGGGRTVPVTYTEKRYVRKPRRSKPGLAVVTNEKVVFVDPAVPN